MPEAWPSYARRLKKRQGKLGDAWHLDEAVIPIQGKHPSLWRAVDQNGDTIDILMQRRRTKKAAVRFFRRLVNGQGGEPRWRYTNQLKSYAAAHRAVMSTVEHINTGTVEKSRQRRSRRLAVLTYWEYAPRVQTAAVLLDGLF